MKTVVLAAIAPLVLCAQNTASIEGRVTNSVTGEAVSGVSVRFLDRHSRVYRTVTDSTGSYRLTAPGDVAPGDYYAVAFDQKGILPAADLPPAIVPIASSVSVEAGSTAQVDLKVNKWPW